MTKEKLASVFLAAFMLFGTAACDTGKPTSKSNDTAATVTSTNSGAQSVTDGGNVTSGGQDTADSASAIGTTSDSADSSASAESGNSTSGQGGQVTPTEPESPPEFLTTLPIPAAYVAENTTAHGTVETITYNTKVYDVSGQGGVTVEKKADVYLPYGYDQNADKQYNVLYLMHGGGETYTYWLTENKKTVNMLDNMFASGKAEPCIVVAPTFYTNAPGSSGGSSTSTLATDVFRWEFRNDLVPTVESTYNTYASADVTESGLIATRMHRGFAGLSMGSMVSIRSIILGCLDICSYINSMSGGYEADDSLTQTGFNLIKEAMTVTFKSYRVDYWLNHNGNNDIALTPHQNLNNMILNDSVMSKRLKEDRNYKWIKFPTGSHSYDSWIAGTYNCLLVFFR